MKLRHGIDPKLRYLKSAGQELSNEVYIVQIELPELPRLLDFSLNCKRETAKLEIMNNDTSLQLLTPLTATS